MANAANSKKNIFSFDSENNGLWGKTFAIGVLVFSLDGEELARFVGRCPIEGPVDVWVADNVLPKMEDIPVTHESYEDLLTDFFEFRKEHKESCVEIVHMGVPVEATLYKDAYTMGLIGDFDGPYPLIDVAGMLYQVGEDPTSVDAYAAKFGLYIRDFGGTHNPLYDSEVTAKVFMHLQA